MRESDSELRKLGMLVGHPARWIAAVICFTYGFAKLNGSQFTVLDSELTKPMGEVSGFWLTWYYFGFSSVYGTLIALLQVAGGLLLTWPRTALIGALFLLPVATNIILIDIFFGIRGALPPAVLLFLCLMIVVLPDVPGLMRALLRHFDSSRRAMVARGVVVSVLLAGAWGFTYWAANYNNRTPTPIDGIWTIEDSAGPLRQIFFEYNRAYMAVFRFEGGRDEVHHFEDDAEGRLRVWEQWLRKGQLVYQGQTINTDRIELWRDGNEDNRFALIKQ